MINLQKNTHVKGEWQCISFQFLKTFFSHLAYFPRWFNIGTYPKNAKPTDTRRLHVLAYVQNLVFTKTSLCLDPNSENSCCFFF